MDAFKLYDTYGFPLELTQEMASEQGLSVDVDAFEKAMEDQRKRARSARQEVEYISERDALFREIREAKGETSFVGYDSLEANSIVLGLFQAGKKVESVAAGAEVEFILDVTPFYAESGGQVSDRGQITGPELSVEIEEVFKPVENLFVHRGKVIKGVLKEYAPVVAQVDQRRRLAICRNHSATHLLHRALKEVLGNHVNQAGSLVEPERLRFDFTHFSALSQDELKKIEDTVNRAVMANLKVEATETSLAEARSMVPQPFSVKSTESGSGL